MLDIACAVGSEVWLDVHAKRLCQTVVNVDQVLSAAVSNILCLTRRFLRRDAGFQIRLDDILNVGKVTALLSVAVDGRRFTVQELLQELRDHRRIGTIGILSASEYVKITHTDSLKPVMSRILLGALLVNALAHGIR